MKVFLDTGSLDEIRTLSKHDLVGGVTTNPSLLNKAGVTDYKSFVREVANVLGTKPLSVEVLSEDLDRMTEEALRLASWADNLYIKIPIVTPAGISSAEVVSDLSSRGVNVNVTAVFTLEQVGEALEALSGRASIISIFCGRIADTCRDAEESMRRGVELRDSFGKSDVELLWASSRQIYDLVQAERSGADIITLGPQMLEKLSLKNKDLHEFSIETSKMFTDDAISAGLQI